MRAPLRVLHLMPSQGDDVGGMERLVSLLAERLAPEKFSAVICLYREGKWGNDLRARGQHVYGIEEHGRACRRRGVARLRALHRRVRRLDRIIEGERVDVVHTHYLGALLHAWLSRARRSRAWVHTEHARPDLVREYPRWLRAVGERLLTLPDRVTAVSEPVGHYLRTRMRAPEARVTVIPNGVDVGRFGKTHERAVKRAELGLAPDARVIGSVANLRPEKNHDVLLQAFARVLRHVPDARLFLVGEGDCRPALERLAAELGVATHVRFLGTRHDVPELLVAFDVHCLASRYEGLPLAVLESMAAGTPVVASAVDGIQDVIRDDISGLLVPPSNAEALKSALLRILGDENLRERLVGEARREVHARFPLEPMVLKYGRVYEQVAGEPRDVARVSPPWQILEEERRFAPKRTFYFFRRRGSAAAGLIKQPRSRDRGRSRPAAGGETLRVRS